MHNKCQHHSLHLLSGGMNGYSVINYERDHRKTFSLFKHYFMRRFPQLMIFFFLPFNVLLAHFQGRSVNKIFPLGHYNNKGLLILLFPAMRSFYFALSLSFIFSEAKQSITVHWNKNTRCVQSAFFLYLSPARPKRLLNDFCRLWTALVILQIVIKLLI